VLLPLALAGSASLNSPMGWAEPARPPVHITLLQLNDVYQIGAVDKGTRGGLARVATLRQRIQAENPHTFFILAGDTLSPSLASKMFQGKQMIDLWNQIGLNIATLGNHEFDFGNDVLLKRLKESKFQWVSANVSDKNTGRPFADLPPYIVQTVEGVKIGFFGLLTPDTLTSSHPGANVAFKDPVLTAEQTVARMQKAGVDVIVAITHLPMTQDQQMARATRHHVALIMGGHEHSLLQSVAGGTPIIKVGSDARNLGRIDLSIDPQTHALQSIDWELIPVDASVPEEPAAAALVKTYEDQIDQALGQVIGTTAVALEARQRPSRSQETNWGDFVADSYRQALETDAALLNGGSLRSNTTYGPGPLSRKDVLSLLPFGNPVVKAAISGQTLKLALEHGVSTLSEQEAGHFPQVSGLRFVYDGMQPAGARVVKVTVNGQPLRLNQTYTLAITTYLLGGGDGYAMLKTAKVLSDVQEAPPDSEVVMDAISRLKTIAPQVDGRIERQDGMSLNPTRP
jgi:2',3'-cyclic-nucleotide 2'-phosphodiesterase (5'-nucleotidase family)